MKLRKKGKVENIKKKKQIQRTSEIDAETAVFVIVDICCIVNGKILPNSTEITKRSVLETDES